jgi:hypothetical protein
LTCRPEREAPGEVEEEGVIAGRQLGWRELATDDSSQDCLAWYQNVYNGPGSTRIVGPAR